MILLDRRAVPRAPDVVLELVGVDEDQRTQERDEHDQREVQDSKEPVHLEDAVAQDERRDQGRDVVDEPQSVPQDVPEDWDEPEDAQRDVQQGEHLRVLVQPAREEDRGEEDGVDARGLAEDHAVLLGHIRYVLLLVLLRLLGLLLARGGVRAVSHLLHLGRLRRAALLYCLQADRELRLLVDEVEVVVDQVDEHEDYTTNRMKCWKANGYSTYWRSRV